MPPQNIPAPKVPRQKNKYGFWVKQPALLPAPTTLELSPKRPLEAASVDTDAHQPGKRTKASKPSAPSGSTPTVVSDHPEAVGRPLEQVAQGPLPVDARATDSGDERESACDDSIRYMYTFPKRHGKLFSGDKVKLESSEVGSSMRGSSGTESAKTSPLTRQFESISLAAQDNLHGFEDRRIRETIERPAPETPSRIPRPATPQLPVTSVTRPPVSPTSVAPKIVPGKFLHVRVPQRARPPKPKPKSANANLANNDDAGSGGSLQRKHDTIRHMSPPQNRTKEATLPSLAAAPPSSLKRSGQNVPVPLASITQDTPARAREDTVDSDGCDLIDRDDDGTAEYSRTKNAAPRKSKLPLPIRAKTPARVLGRGLTPIRVNNFERIAARIAQKRSTRQQRQADIFTAKIKTRGVTKKRLELFWVALTRCSDAGELFAGDPSQKDNRPRALVSRHDGFMRCIEMVNRKVLRQQRFDKLEGGAMLQELQNQLMLSIAGKDKRTVFLTRDAQDRLGL